MSSLDAFAPDMYCEECRTGRGFFLTSLGSKHCTFCGWSKNRDAIARPERDAMLSRIETLEREWWQWRPLPTTLAKVDAVENRVTALEREYKLIGERDVARQQRYEAEQQITAALEARTERMLVGRYRAYTRGIGLDAFATSELQQEITKRMEKLEESKRKISQLEEELAALQKPRGRGKRV